VIKSRTYIWTGDVVEMEKMKYKCKILVGKPERKRLFGRAWMEE
jgi:hypothetical protein